MRRIKEHCDNFISSPEPCYKVNAGDCIRPIHGRFYPSRCNGVCEHYTDSAYKLKRALEQRTGNKE